jgi:hypothetical protein
MACLDTGNVVAARLGLEIGYAAVVHVASCDQQKGGGGNDCRLQVK